MAYLVVLVQGSLPHDNGDGGWNPDPEYEHRFGMLPSTRRQPDVLFELSQETFDKEYKHKKPFILRRPSFSTKMRELTEKAHMLNKYGKYKINLGTQLEIASGGRGSTKTTLRQFIEQLPHHRAAGSIPEDFTFFDRTKFMKKAKSLARHMSIPVDPRSPMEKMFTIGDSGSGVSFHIHNDAWNELLHGRKRWAMYPPGNMTSLGCNPKYRLAQWLEDVYPQVPDSERPLQFIQEIGDLVYVPEGWHHATVNIGETVAFAFQISRPAPEGCMFYFTTITDYEYEPDIAVERAKKALELCGEEAHIYNQMGMLYAMRDTGTAGFPDWAQAEKYFRRALALNPRLGSAYENLALVLRDSGADTKALRVVLTAANKHRAGSSKLQAITGDHFH